MLAAILTICGTMTLTSCDNDDNSIVPTPDEAVVLNCVKPDYLKAGDKVALISPSYFTAMDTWRRPPTCCASGNWNPSWAQMWARSSTDNMPGRWPSVSAISAGHGDINLPLVMGAPVTLDVRQDGATLQFNIEGDQNEVRTADITAPSTPTATRMRLAGKRE